MPKHIWSVLCYKGCLDQYTNQVSLLDVIENISLRPTGPAPSGNVHIPIQMNLVSLWMRSDLNSPETFETRIIVKAPDGFEHPSNELVADLQTHTRIRTFRRFEILPYRGPGLYEFIVEYRGTASDAWNSVVAVPLDVRVEEVPAGAPATPKTVRRRRRLRRIRRTAAKA